MDKIENYVATATRQFTDRQKPRALFEESIKNLHKTKVISFYGMGGIGKTRLLTYLKNEAKHHDANCLTISIDFHESYFRNIGEFLNTLKFQLLQHEKINFYAFDLAYAIYWARTQPGDLPMERANTFVQEDHILFDILDSLDGIPYANLIPKAVNLMSKIPQHTKKSSWWKTTGNALAAKLSVIHDIQALRDILLNLWVSDVIDHFINTNRKLLFFFDSFESLDLSRLPRIKTLTAQFDRLPVLFIIGSRTKLNWESTDTCIIDEHIIGALSEEDARTFLVACQLQCEGENCSCQQLDGSPTENAKLCAENHEKILHKIIHVTKGIPIFLDLMVDTYLSIKKSQMPKPEHFTDDQTEIVPLLLQHFQKEDLAFLELLSFPNYWNYNIVKLLIREFTPGVGLASVNRFYEYSFIHYDSPEQITMQDFVRKWLQQQLQQKALEYYTDVHQTLFTYYDEQLKATPNFKLFNDAAFHAIKVLPRATFEQWLQDTITIVLNKGYIDGIAQYLQQLLPQKQLSLQAAITCQTTMLNCYLQLGQYNEIIEQANEAIDLANEANRSDFRAKIQYIVGSSYYAMSEYEQAIKYYRLATALNDNPLQAIDAHMKIGKISVTLSDFETARGEYLQASKLIHTLLQQNSTNTELNSLAGQCYEKLGELMAYSDKREEQLRLYKQSIHYLTIATQDKQHPNYLQHVTLLGFSTKRLAEAYELQGGDAIQAFYEAIAYYEEVLTAIPHSIDTLEKLGHACADLMRVTRDKKLETAFHSAFDKAKQAFTTVVELAPKQGSSLNRLSSIMLEMAKYYMDQLDYSNAKLYLDKASSYYERTITSASKYAYAPAKKKAIDEAMARYERETALN